MSLADIEFVNPEEVSVKREDSKDDFYHFSYCSSTQSAVRSNLKCGEIFTSNNSDFTLICAFCDCSCDNIFDFGEHLRSSHKKALESGPDYDNKPSVGSLQAIDEYEVVGDIDHPVQVGFICKDCEEEFPSLQSLKKHKCRMRKECMQSGKESYNTRSSNPGDLHTSEKCTKLEKATFSCASCNRQYSTQNNLTKHKCFVVDTKMKETGDHLHPNINVHEAVESSDGESKCSTGVDFSSLVKSEVLHEDREEDIADSSSRPLKIKKKVQGNKVSNPDLYCEICDRQFKYKNIFKKHGMQHPVAPLALQKDPDYLKCCYCGLKVLNNAAWYEHENSHTESTPFQCAYCPKRFKTRLEVEMHTNSHTGARPFKCDQCEASFAHSNNLSTHIKRVHLRLTPFSCTLCDKKFLRNVELRIHMRQHTGERPYQCEECGRSFMIAVQLNEHLKRHTNVRDVVCPVCPMAFFTKKMLRKHMVKHSTERPHVCTICGRTFSRKKALDVHIKIHQDVKEYVCTICGKAFAQPAGLYSHKKSHMHSVTS